MQRMIDYTYLLQHMLGTPKTNLVNNIQLSQINSRPVQAQLKAAASYKQQAVQSGYE